MDTVPLGLDAPASTAVFEKLLQVVIGMHIPSHSILRAGLNFTGLMPLRATVA
jgi:hypothetical protein